MKTEDLDELYHDFYNDKPEAIALHKKAEALIENPVFTVDSHGVIYRVTLNGEEHTLHLPSSSRIPLHNGPHYEWPYGLLLDGISSKELAKDIINISEEAKAKAAKPIAEKPILMGTDNHNGYKLDELLQKLVDEVRAKSDKISGSEHQLAYFITEQNYNITQLLLVAKNLHIETYKRLDAIEPNRGPGSPRL